VIDNFRKIVENRSNLGPITLFLGAKRVFFDRRTTGHRAWKKDRRGGLFWRVRRGFNFESRKFIIWSFLIPKTTI